MVKPKASWKGLDMKTSVPSTDSAHKFITLDFMTSRSQMLYGHKLLPYHRITFLSHIIYVLIWHPCY